MFVRPHFTARHPLDGFSLNFMLEGKGREKTAVEN
jgi:hypothetical protein